MTAKTELTRDVTRAHIQLAMDNLYAAAAAASDLQGWAEEWKAIGDEADRVKALWHHCNDAPLPTGHDYDTPAAS